MIKNFYFFCKILKWLNGYKTHLPSLNRELSDIFHSISDSPCVKCVRDWTDSVEAVDVWRNCYNNLQVLNCFEEWWDMLLHFYIICQRLSWCRSLKQFRVEDKKQFITHCQYHSSWWSYNTRSQSIITDIDVLLSEYCILNTWDSSQYKDSLSQVCGFPC